MDTYCCRFISCLLLAGSILLPVMGSTTGDPTSGSQTHISRSKAFFGIHLDLHPGAQDTILGRDTRPENISAFLDRVKPDFMQYDCKGHAGYTGYPAKVGYPSPGIVQDALALWRTETRKRGIGLYIHYSGVWDSAAIQHHPEWAVTRADGSRDPNATSPFGDYVDQLLLPQLKEVTRQYDLDGVWVDGDCWAAQIDYGTTASLQWKDISGTETLPRKPGDPLWQEWKAFHREAFEKYLVHWIDELHQFNPALELTSNWSYTPHMPVPVRANVDFISGDFSAKESVDRARFEARYISSTGKPWDLMAWGFNGYEDGFQGAHQWKTAEQLKQEAAVVLALGGGMQVYYQPTRGGYLSRAITEIAGQVADFCRERQALSHKSESVPQVALLLSTASYLHRSDNVYSPGGQYNALEGALHALLESGYSVDMLSEHQLAPRMKDYPVIVLAQAPILEPAFHRQLLDYVRDGGHLVFLDWESAAPFQKDLGVSLTGNLVNTEAYVGDLNGTAPVPGLWQPVELASAEALAYRTNRDGETTRILTEDGAYGYMESSLEIAATRTAYGKGSLSATYGPVSQAYFQTHNAYLLGWVSEILNQAFPEPRAHLQGLPSIDMSLRKLPDGREVVHLVNLANAQRASRFATVTSVPAVPRSNGILVWKTQKKPVKIVSYPGGDAVKFTSRLEGDGQFINRLVIDNVPIHQVCVAEYE